MVMYDIGFPHLGIYIQNLRNSIYIGNFSIAFYGILIGIAMVIGLFLTWKEARRTGQKEDDYTDSIIWIIIFGVIGARLYYVLFEWSYYKDNLAEIINTRSGGLAIFGGIIAGIITLVVFCCIKKRNFLLMVDTIIPQVCLAQAIGRWGNFFNMEAFGRYTDGLLAMQLKLEKVSPIMVGTDHMENLLNIGGVEYIQVTPTFFIESMCCLIFFFILIWTQRHKKFNGEVFFGYLGLYGIERAIVEGMRSDSLMLGSIRVSQLVAVICIVIALTGLVIFAYINKMKHPAVLIPPAAADKDNTDKDNTEKEV